MSNLAELLPDEWAQRLRAHQLQTGRQLVEERQRTPEEEVFATATPLDGLLGGGLRRSTLVELVGWGSSGRFSLVLGTLAAATLRGEAVALVDLGDALDPRIAEAAGVELPRLLWARPRRLKEALGAVESILEAGLPVVVLDLGIPPVPGGRGVEAFWLRVGRAAQAHRSALLVSSPYRVTGTAAHAVVEARDRRAGWLGRGLEPKLLAGVHSRLDLVKGAGWREGRAEELTLRPPTPVVQPESGEDDAARDTERGTERDTVGETVGKTVQPLAEVHLWRPRAAAPAKTAMTKTGTSA